MDFSTSEEISEDALGIARNSTADQAAAADDLKWLYSSIYIVVPVVQILVAYPLFRYNWSTMLLGVSLNVACAWLRYAAVVRHSYAMGLASSCLAGGAAAVIVSSYSIVPENWFGPSERGLATAIGVQANYLGWGFGVLLPLYVDSLSAFTTFCFWQALAMSLAIPVFVLGYRAPPASAAAHHHEATSTYPSLTDASSLPIGGVADAGSSAGHAAHEVQEAKLETGASLVRLLTSPRYLVHAFACAVLGGISFAITGVQDLILEGGEGCTSLDLPPSQTTWTNFAFVSVGVLSGLIIGQSVQSERAQRYALVGLSALSALALTALSALASSAVFSHMNRHVVYALLIVSMGLSGVGLLGFISVALRMAVHLGSPASEVFSAGGLELMLQCFSALFAQTLDCHVQFIPCAIATWVCCALLALVHLT